MIDGVVLMAIIVPVVITLFVFMVQLINGNVGSKGITQPYKTKSGKTHTAKKERSEYIV
jgi:hypothetical protein